MQDVITADGRGGECSVMFLMIEPTTYHSNGGDLGGDPVGAGGNLPVVLLAPARVEDL